MKNPNTRLLLMATVLSLLGSVWPTTRQLAADEQTKRPNFIFILTDDQGWSQVSIPMDPTVPRAASKYLETPNIERLARRGMRFGSGYSPAPLCTPTRRSILCGMTPARQRGTEFRSEFNWQGVTTLPKSLKAVDPAYRCAHFGKFGSQMGATPEEVGFDESDGPTTNRDGGCPQDMEERGKTEVNDDPKLTTSMTRRAVAFLEKQVRQKNPFYLQVSYYATHLQVQTRERMLKKYTQKGQPDRAVTPGFAGMLEELDAGIGQILDTVDRLGISDRTYLVFTADNGGRGTIPGADESLAPPNRPLYGAKHSLYEGGIRVPFIAIGPGIEPHSYCAVPVAAYDLLPTFYDLAGGREPLPPEVDGGSLRSVLKNQGTGEVKRGLEGLVFHRPRRRSDPQSCIRVGNWKLLLLWKTPKRPRQSLLFDLDQDLGEERDLSSEHPEKAEELQRLLIGYLNAVNAEAPAGQRIE